MDAIHQLGENIEVDKPLHILIFGRDTSESKSQKTILLSICSEGFIKVHILGEDNAIPHDEASQIFIDTMNSDKCTRLITQQGSQIKISKLVKQVGEQEQISLRLEEERTVELSEGERIVAHTNGMLIVEGASGKSRSIFVHQNLEKRALSGSTSTHNHNPSDESSMTSASAAPEQRIKESQVLEMSIDAG